MHRSRTWDSNASADGIGPSPPQSGWPTSWRAPASPWSCGSTMRVISDGLTTAASAAAAKAAARSRRPRTWPRPP
eukprot:8653525-Alexandrium_andersonii.AAC.1